MPSQGPYDPGTVAQTGLGVSWYSQDNIKTSGSCSYGSAYASLSLFSASSKYIVASNFGFSIPSGATVSGILVEIMRCERSGSGVVTKDEAVYLTNSSYEDLGNNKADTANNYNTPGSSTYKQYGGQSDSWGYSFTPSIVNSSGFGVKIKAKSHSLTSEPGIIHVRMTVYYSGDVSFEVSTQQVSIEVPSVVVTAEQFVSVDTNVQDISVQQQSPLVSISADCIVSTLSIGSSVDAPSLSCESILSVSTLGLLAYNSFDHSVSGSASVEQTSLTCNIDLLSQNVSTSSESDVEIGVERVSIQSLAYLGTISTQTVTEILVDSFSLSSVLELPSVGIGADIFPSTITSYVYNETHSVVGDSIAYPPVFDVSVGFPAGTNVDASIVYPIYAPVLGVGVVVGSPSLTLTQNLQMLPAYLHITSGNVSFTFYSPPNYTPDSLIGIYECDICGFDFRKRDLIKTRDGKMVCKRDYDLEHTGRC